VSVRSAFFAIILLGMTVLPVAAESTVNVGGGVIAILNFDPANGITGIVPAVSVSFPVMTFDASNALNLRFLLWGADYNWSGGKAVPSEIENRKMLVAGCIGGVTYAFNIPMDEHWNLALEAGAALNLRVPVSLAPAYDSLYSSFFGYLYGAARFIMPDTGFSFRYKFSDAIGLCGSVNAYWPLFHIWDMEGSNFFDQTILAGLFEIVIYY
jgi:hypothetical protein